MTQIRDSLVFDASGLTQTKDGFLVGDAKVSRAGNVQTYFGIELGLFGDEAQKEFNVYRDPNTVFDEQSMMSLAGRPVTRNHPQKPVTADNYRELSVGHMGAVIKRDGEHVVAPMAIMDAEAVKEVLGGARSLSAGYTVDIQRESGVTPDGQKYDFRQAGNLRFNHVAYLPDNNPRAGNTRFGDDGGCIWGRAPLTTMETSDETKAQQMTDTLKPVVLGDAVAHVSATDAAIVEKFKADMAAELADMKKKYDEEMSEKEKEMGEKDEELKKMKDSVLSDEDIDKRVQSRAALLSAADAISPGIEIKGLTDAEIRKTVVEKMRGEDAVKDRADAYVEAIFDSLHADAKAGDPLKKPLADKANNHNMNTGDSWGFLDAKGDK